MLNIFIFIKLLIPIICAINKNTIFKSKYSKSKSFISIKYKPITYKSVDITFNKMQLLIQSDEKHILNDISKWKSNDINKLNDDKINNWIQQGIAFWSNSEGTQDIHSIEKEKITENYKNFKYKPRIAVDIYINHGTIREPLYVSADVDFSKDSINNQKVYRNLSMLFLTEQILHRADNIANRLKNEFPITSPEWERWTNKTSAYNASSLTQVFAEYFKDQSIGDIGDSDVDYVPKPGYPGTLQPGTKFKDLYAFEDLPREVLHPWPAMQQIQFHVRWPPSHPMIPPPLLWIGMNNMYSEKFTYNQLNLPDSDIVGGLLMEPKDAIRIAKYGKFGLSYVPDEQLSHGGMVFDSACKIPNYNPDHGPTRPDFMPNIPEKLKAVTERWLDPYHGLDQEPHKLLLESTELQDAKNEEDVRKKAFEQMLFTSQLSGFKKTPTTTESKPIWKVVEEAETETLEKEVDARILEQTLALEKQFEEMNEQEISGDNSAVNKINIMINNEKTSSLKDTLYYDINLNVRKYSMEVKLANTLIEDEITKRKKFRNEILNAQKLINIAQGNESRGKRALIKYTIESMEDMVEEIKEEERDVLIKPRKGKRKARRKDDTGNTINNDVDDNIVGYIEPSVSFSNNDNVIGGYDLDLGSGSSSDY